MKNVFAMSKVKTKSHPFYYEGGYFRDRAHYAAYIKAKRNVVVENPRTSIASLKSAA
jgi:hypothetical protein